MSYNATGRPEGPGIVFRLINRPYVCLGCGETKESPNPNRLWCAAPSCQEKKRKSDLEKQKKQYKSNKSTPRQRGEKKDNNDGNKVYEGPCRASKI